MDVHVHRQGGAARQVLPANLTLVVLRLTMDVESAVRVQRVALLERLPTDVTDKVAAGGVNVAFVFMEAVLVLERLLTNVTLYDRVVHVGFVVGTQVFLVFEGFIALLTQ